MNYIFYEWIYYRPSYFIQSTNNRITLLLSTTLLLMAREKTKLSRMVKLENVGKARTHFHENRRNSKEHQNQRVSLSLCYDGEVSRWFIINAGLKPSTLKRRSWRGGKSCIFHEVQPALVAVPEVALELVEPAEHLVTAGIK